MPSVETIFVKKNKKEYTSLGQADLKIGEGILQDPLSQGQEFSLLSLDDFASLCQIENKIPCKHEFYPSLLIFNLQHIQARPKNRFLLGGGLIEILEFTAPPFSCRHCRACLGPFLEQSLVLARVIKSGQIHQGSLMKPVLTLQKNDSRL